MRTRKALLPAFLVCAAVSCSRAPDSSSRTSTSTSAIDVVALNPDCAKISFCKQDFPGLQSVTVAGPFCPPGFLDHYDPTHGGMTGALICCDVDGTPTAENRGPTDRCPDGTAPEHALDCAGPTAPKVDCYIGGNVTQMSFFDCSDMGGIIPPDECLPDGSKAGFPTDCSMALAYEQQVNPDQNYTSCGAYPAGGCGPNGTAIGFGSGTKVPPTYFQCCCWSGAVVAAEAGAQ